MATEQEYYDRLVGGKITRIEMEPDEEGGEPWPILHIEFEGKIDAVGRPVVTTVEVAVQRDPEGNGAGFLAIPDEWRPQ